MGINITRLEQYYKETQDYRRPSVVFGIVLAIVAFLAIGLYDYFGHDRQAQVAPRQIIVSPR